MTRVRLGVLIAALCALQALAQHPFGGEVLDLNAEVQAIRQAETLEARQAAAGRLSETLYKDPYLAELGPRMGLERHLADLVHGRPFDAEGFRADGQRAVEAGGIGSADVGKPELLQKLEVLDMALSAPKGAPSVQLANLNVEEARLARVLGTNGVKTLSLQPVPGARVVQLSETVALPGTGPREALALELYGRVLGESAGEGVLRPGLAHREVGRAVLGPPVPHPLGAETADVLKGIGPTPGRRARTASTPRRPAPSLPEAVRDWQKTETLRRAGVAIYEPVAIVALPYMEWSKSEGWRPVAVFVRRARENLRVSDLDHMSRQQKARLLAELKAKLEAELRGVGRTQPLSDGEVIRAFVERMGRTAGIFQGGIGQGRFFFHGMLHDQNVSLLGEIPDVGNSDGEQRSRQAMQRAWEGSNYTWWPDQLKEYASLKGATVETALFHRLAHLYNQHLAPVAQGGGMSEAEVLELFGKAYREGRRGVSAADPRRTLTIELERPAGTERELERYRRADRTVDWARVRHEGAALGQFTLALFLKELAVVAATGDRVRTEEFFDYLLSTDFYLHYGLFVGGARATQAVYLRTLERRLRPGFVNGVLKNSLVLGAGLALPMLVEGQLSGRSFAISLTSLGLSSAAVQGGVKGLRWVVELKSAQGRSALARFGASGSRLARLGGWFYTAAELAVVLYVAEQADHWATARLDLADARATLADAGQTFFAAAAAAEDPGAFEAALDAYHAAWVDYREHLATPLHRDEALLRARLEGPAEQAREAAEARAVALERLEQHPNLKQRVLAEHGSLQAYVEHLVAADEARIAADSERYLDAYAADSARHAREVYREHRREGALLEGLDDAALHLGGGDPYAGRGDVLARLGRRYSTFELRSALRRASRNRPQAYDDELEVLAALSEVYGERPLLREVLAARAASVRAQRAQDTGLVAPRAGVTSTLEASASR
ncbi:MAG: hypothetical protein R3F62_27455 [Planctomycetota bacterium]